MVLKVEDLAVYRMAEELADKVWNICIGWDYFAKDAIGKQLVCTADSISANLAEGHGRYHFKDRLNFCYYARGSLEETKTWLSKAIRRGLIASGNNDINQIMDLLPKKMNAYIGSIKKVHNDQKTDKK
jgi:four helix bundle protein